MPGVPGVNGAVGPTGPQGALGAAPTALWALVDEGGQLLEGNGLVSVTGKEPYVVTFNRSVASCGITGSLDLSPVTSIYAQPDEGRAAVFTTVGGTPTPSDFTVVASC